MVLLGPHVLDEGGRGDGGGGAMMAQVVGSNKLGSLEQMHPHAC